MEASGSLQQYSRSLTRTQYLLVPLCFWHSERAYYIRTLPLGLLYYLYSKILPKLYPIKPRGSVGVLGVHGILDSLSTQMLRWKIHAGT